MADTAQMRECRQLVSELEKAGFEVIALDANPASYLLPAYERFFVHHTGLMGGWSLRGWPNEGRFFVLHGAIAGDHQTAMECRRNNTKMLRKYESVIAAAKAMQVCS